MVQDKSDCCHLFCAIQVIQLIASPSKHPFHQLSPSIKQLPEEDPPTIKPKNSKTMDGLSEWRNELKYRGFMARLSDQITAQDFEKLKYMLTPLIRKGRMESLDTVIKLFDCLEEMLFVGPNNLDNLKETFFEMDKPKLCQMVAKFIRDGATRTVQSSTETAMNDSFVSDPWQRR